MDYTGIDRFAVLRKRDRLKLDLNDILLVSGLVAFRAPGSSYKPFHGHSRAALHEIAQSSGGVMAALAPERNPPSVSI
jgi:hypothetical protein